LADVMSLRVKKFFVASDTSSTSRPSLFGYNPTDWVILKSSRIGHSDNEESMRLGCGSRLAAAATSNQMNGPVALGRRSRPENIRFFGGGFRIKIVAILQNSRDTINKRRIYKCSPTLSRFHCVQVVT